MGVLQNWATPLKHFGAPINNDQYNNLISWCADISIGLGKTKPETIAGKPPHMLGGELDRNCKSA